MLLVIHKRIMTLFALNGYRKQEEKGKGEVPLQSPMEGFEIIIFLFLLPLVLMILVANTTINLQIED